MALTDLQTEDDARPQDDDDDDDDTETVTELTEGVAQVAV
jgi:hypothetical protein